MKDVENIIDEEHLQNFIAQLPSLSELDFSSSNIKQEHIDKLKLSLKFE